MYKNYVFQFSSALRRVMLQHELYLALINHYPNRDQSKRIAEFNYD